jgi:hypothetical protein
MWRDHGGTAAAADLRRYHSLMETIMEQRLSGEIKVKQGQYKGQGGLVKGYVESGNGIFLLVHFFTPKGELSKTKDLVNQSMCAQA